MWEEFIESVKKFQSEFALDLPPEKIEKLAHFYELILEQNEILHLVAPVSTEEFVIRHILESLTLLEHLPNGAVFADIGPGAGLPSIPCLLVRDDLKSVLIESKARKSAFLETVIEKCNLENRAELINRQFEECEFPEVQFVSCRALDKFTKKLPKLLRWSKNSAKLFFGGNNLAAALDAAGAKFEQRLMPESDQRFLFIVSSAK